MKQGNGHITIASDTNVQPHELNTAQAIATSGFDVEFVRRTWGNRVTSADAVINGVVWEMKSPQASDRKALERNLRKASHQSPNVIIDSQRLKGASDAEIEKRLRSICPHIRAIRRLWFINRRRSIIDIKH